MSFEIALSGINAINTQLDTISNNIANTGTYGFKSSRANFASMYADVQPTGVEVSSLTQTLGIGGGIISTGRSLDVAISGGGFFVTRDATGAEVYTRVGIFAKDKEGYLVDSFGRKVQGYAAVEGSDELGAMGDLRVTTGQVPAKASTSVDYVGNLSADWEVPTAAFDPLDPTSFNSSVVTVVYDTLGAQHTVTQYFRKTAANEVDVHYVFDGDTAAPIGPHQLTFAAGDGKLDGATAAYTLGPLTTTNGSADITVAFDYTGTTQYAGTTTTTTNSTDGYASGALSGLQIDEDGSVMAQYSNGVKQKLGTLVMATFPNENALVPLSDTSWTTSNGSGTPLYSTAGVGMAGKLAAGALEQSNVDMTAELVTLMTAQRNYQANTKVISTQDEMMQNLMQAV